MGAGAASEASRGTAGYRPRDPEQGVLRRVLGEHLRTFLARVEQDETRAGLPRHVCRELQEAFGCGVLAHGFARVRCGGCGEELLVAFSCKGRGFCPSCGGRRMAERAAHLVDHVLPPVAVRQWVLSMPWRVRFLLACDPELAGAVRRSFLRAVLEHYRRDARRAGSRDVRAGAVNVVQRFGSALNLNVHFHALVLDGVYTADGPLATPVFREAGELEDEDVERLVRAIRDRILGLLRRRGLWPDPGEEGSEASLEQHSLLPLLAAASIQGRVALGPDAGSPVPRLGTALDPAAARGTASDDGELCASLDGFSLHARIRVGADERERLEHLCRYVCRPALAGERLALDSRGRVRLELRRPWRDGTTHLLFEPLVFLERLAALVPHPREHQLTYHGVLAPGSSWRDLVVPVGPAAVDATCGAGSHAVATPRREGATGGSTGRLGDLEEGGQAKAKSSGLDSSWDASGQPISSARTSSRYSWAELLRRVFAIDVLRCPTCGARRRLIALITHGPVVRRILEHLGLPAEPPALMAARSPPQLELGY